MGHRFNCRWTQVSHRGFRVDGRAKAGFRGARFSGEGVRSYRKARISGGRAFLGRTGSSWRTGFSVGRDFQDEGFWWQISHRGSDRRVFWWRVSERRLVFRGRFHGGGFTVAVLRFCDFPGFEVSGFWVSGGTMFQEQVSRFRVSCFSKAEGFQEAAGFRGAVSGKVRFPGGWTMFFRGRGFRGAVVFEEVASFRWLVIFGWYY